MLGPHTSAAATLRPELAAQQLLVLRYYAAGGTHTNHPVHPKQGKFLAGPLRGTMSLHPHAPTLAQTLIGHLVPCPDDSTEFGTPFWEAPLPENPVAPHRQRAGLLEQLAARQDKTMLLRTNQYDVIDGFTIAEGPGTASDLAVADPYVLTGSDQQPVKPRQGRAFWREAESLLAQTEHGRAELTAPVLDWARGEFAPDVAVHDPKVFSWAVVSHIGDKSKDLVCDISAAPNLLALFKPATSLLAKAFLDAAADVEGVMCRQLAKVRRETCTMPARASDKAAVYAPARAELYKRAEADFWDVAAGTLTAEERDRRLRLHALAGYDIATAAFTRDPRTLGAVEESRRWVSNWPPAKPPAPTRQEAK
jgi:hypothetical protein